MKVLHINCNYLGTTLHQLMIEELDSFGIENDVFVPTYDRNQRVIEPNDNVFVSECFNRADRAVFDYKQNKILKSIEETFNVSEYDLIHAYTLFTDGNCARKLSKKYGIPYVVAIRNTDVNVFFKRMIHLRNRGIKTMADAAAVCFLSEAYKQQVFQKYIPESCRAIIETKTNVIPNGIDEFWFKNIGCKKELKQDKSIKLIYAGVINKNKNILATIKAMDILEDRGFRVSLTAVGRVLDVNIFNSFSNDKRVCHIDSIPKEQLIDYYRSCDIFVMPSKHESFGLVYAEAMSQGLPVIYTENQGFDGQFPEGTIGFHVKANSSVDIANKIQDIINNYEIMSEAALECSNKFSWGYISKSYWDLYHKI